MRLRLNEAFLTARDEGRIRRKHELAAAVGLSDAQLSAIMQGKTRLVSIDLVATICHRLGCTPNDLWGWDTDTGTESQATNIDFFS
jgi:DNA-binding Xre family transcriptional regulator